MIQDNHDGVITHQETNILEWEVKWALGSIPIYKASGGDSSWAISNPERWCCESDAHNMPANLEKSEVATGLEKVSFHSNAKECSNYRTIALISHAGKVMLKILQARLQQYIAVNFQMFKLDLEKAEEPEIKLPVSVGSSKKQKSSRKTYTFALLTMPKPLYGSQQTVENS